MHALHLDRAIRAAGLTLGLASANAGTARTPAPAPINPPVPLEVVADGGAYVIRKPAPSQPPKAPVIAVGSHIHIEAALLERSAPLGNDRHDAR